MRHVFPVDFSKFPDGFHSEIMAGPKTGVDNCYLICSRVPPRASGPALHIHPADQFYYVLSGTMNVQLGKVSRLTTPSTSVRRTPSTSPTRTSGEERTPTSPRICMAR